MTPKITDVKFQQSNDRHGDMEIIATMDDGTTRKAFAFFSDELCFEEHEFIGMTILEARDLKMRRDIEYLQS